MHMCIQLTRACAWHVRCTFASFLRRPKGEESPAPASRGAASLSWSKPGGLHAAAPGVYPGAVRELAEGGVTRSGPTPEQRGAVLDTRAAHTRTHTRVHRAPSAVRALRARLCQC